MKLFRSAPFPVVAAPVRPASTPHRRRELPLKLAVLLYLLALIAAPVTAQRVRDGFAADVNGTVYDTSMLPDGGILVAGAFTEIAGQPQAYLARLHHDGTLDSGFAPLLDGAVEAVAVQADGAVLIGGSFTTVDGSARPHLARLAGDGSLDGAFDPAPDARVGELSVQPDGRILVGGVFGTIAGTARARLARLNPNGSPDFGFAPTISGFGPITGEITALALQTDGAILIGGAFLQVNGQPRSFAARLAADGSLDAGFNPAPNGAVFSFAVQADGKLLVGGNFTSIAGQARDGIARLLADGSADAAFSSSASLDPIGGHYVRRIAIQADGRIVLAGQFFGVGGLARNHIARLGADGSVDAGFDPNVEGGDGEGIHALALQADGSAVIGGGFASLGGHARLGLARILGDGHPDRTLGALGLTGPVWAAVAQADGKLLVGGDFSAIGGGTRLARLHADGTLDGSFIAQGVPVVQAIAVQADGRILVGGSAPDSAAGAHRVIVRLNVDGSPDPTFHVPQFGSSSVLPPLVYAIREQPDGRIVVGGYFFTADGEDHLCLVRLHADGTVDASFSPTPNNTVHSLALQPDGKILIGGLFAWVDSVASIHVARLNPDGSPDTTFRSAIGDSLFSGVSSLLLQADGKLLVGGIYYSAGGQPNNGFARLNRDGSLDTDFGIAFSAGHPTSMAELGDGRLLLLGQTNLDGTKAPERYFADGRRDVSYHSPDFGGNLRSLSLLADGKTLVGGAGFTSVDGEPRTQLARLSATAAAAPALVLDGATAVWRQDGDGPEPAWPVRLAYSTTGAEGSYLELGPMERGADGWRLSGLSLPVGQTFHLRATAGQAAGYYNGSSGRLQTTRQFHRADEPAVATVTPSAGAGGLIAPALAQTVAVGSVLRLRLSPDPGHWIAGVGGDCGGSLDGDLYTTAPVTSDCTVQAQFTDREPLPPTIEVGPGSLSFSVPMDAGASQPLTIANLGDAALDFLIDTALPRTLGGYLPPVQPAGLGDARFIRFDAAGAARGQPWTSPQALVALSQMADDTPVAGNGVACAISNGNVTAQTSWWRRYYLHEHAGVGARSAVRAVTIASESGPTIPVTVNVYTIPASVPIDTIPTGQLTRIGSADGTVGGTLTQTRVPLDALIEDTAATDLVVEYRIDAVPDARFYPGGNPSAESHPTFISAPSCGVVEPTPVAAIGAPEFHLVMVVEVDEPSGCLAIAPVDWLSAGPAAGQVAPAGSVAATVAVDTTGLNPGTHTSLVCIASNDPQRPRVAVPVTLTVTHADFIFRSDFDPE